MFVFLLQATFAYSNGIPTVKEQLENLNQFWKSKNFDDQILKERLLLDNDVKLIQTHLSLVEQKLRDKNIESFSDEQKTNRLNCLDILHEYWTNGVFPKNLYHNKRTPYFIDDYGTACAVGQLIISTGNEDVAKQISKENNYGYINDLILKYNKIEVWAHKYGFTLDELAWIQPTYGCVNPICADNTQRNVSCYGGNDGCFGAQPSHSLASPPFMFQYYYYNTATSMWVVQSAPCDLIAGMYKVVVIDVGGNTQDIFYTISQPSPIASTINSTIDNGACDGSATITVSGGTGPYSFQWTPSGQTTQTASGLCNGTYSITVTDSLGCTKTDSVTINIATEIDENNKLDFIAFPNPVDINLTVKIGHFLNTTISISNSLGQVVLTKQLTSKTTELDLSNLENGIFIITLNDGKSSIHQKIIKNTN